MKKWLVVFVFLVCLSSIEATTLISPGNYLLTNETYYDEQIIDVNNIPLSIQINPSYQVQLEYDGQSILLHEYECTTKQPYRYCLFNVSTDEHGNYFSETQINMLLGTVTVTRSFSQTNALLGEVVKGTIGLTNTGSSTISNVLYKEEFPDYIVLHQSDDMTFLKNQTLWNDTLVPGQFVSLDYYFYAKEDGIIEHTGNVSYFDGYNNTENITDEITLTFNDTLYTSLQNDTVSVGEENLLNITFVNDYKKEAFVDLEIRFPDEVSITSAGDFTTDENDLYWSDSLSLGERANMEVLFFSKESGTRNISVVITELLVDGITLNNVGGSFELETTVDPFEFESTWDTTESAKENTEKQIVVVATNPNPSVIFENIIVNATLGNKTIHEKEYPDVGALDDFEIGFYFLVPEVSAQETKKLNLSFTYETRYGEKLTSNITRNLNILADDGVDIIKTISNTTLIANQTINVTVTVINNRGIDIDDVLVQDIYSSDFEIIKGLSKKYVSLESDEELEVYSYLLVAPDLEYDKEYIFGTRVEDDIDAHLTTYTIQDTVFVAGAKGPAPIVEIESNETVGNGTNQTSTNETLLNDNTQSNNQQDESISSQGKSGSSMGGVVMLFVFWIPLVLLVLGIIAFIILVKKGMIVLHLPHIKLLVTPDDKPTEQPQQPMQQASVEVQQPVAQQAYVQPEQVPSDQVQQQDPQTVQQEQQPVQQEAPAVENQEPTQAQPEVAQDVAPQEEPAEQPIESTPEENTEEQPAAQEQTEKKPDAPTEVPKPN